ncbi:MAG: HAMP domain-containing histidine kinase [Catenulispora sp.]|nr:HAMP domain-containing histidine kinase [Catenulispora sp.]
MAGDTARGRSLPRFRRFTGTVRLRLTVAQAGLIVVSGVVLLALTFLLVAASPPPRFTTTDPPGKAAGTSDGTMSVPVGGVSDQAWQHTADLHRLLIGSALALAVMALLAVGVGWFAAGRILRPLRAMTAATRQIQADNLHRRLAVTGPRDELKDLGDTIDSLLSRLESAFVAQRGFVANASHELRTPLTVSRVMLEVALADPDASAKYLRATCEELLEVSRQQERLIDALLTLARSQRGLDPDHVRTIDLAAVTADVLKTASTGQAARRVRVSATLDNAPTSGDPRLVERLIANLVDNALRHNLGDGGLMTLSTGTRSGHAVLTVENTGPRIAADQLDRLVQPFQRAVTDRTASPDGLGLGMSIVAAVAEAHGAELGISAGLAGGLRVDVAFPSSCSASGSC